MVNAFASSEPVFADGGSIGVIFQTHREACLVFQHCCHREIGEGGHVGGEVYDPLPWREESRAREPDSHYIAFGVPLPLKEQKYPLIDGVDNDLARFMSRGGKLLGGYETAVSSHQAYAGVRSTQVDSKGQVLHGFCSHQIAEARMQRHPTTMQ